MKGCCDTQIYTDFSKEYYLNNQGFISENPLDVRLFKKDDKFSKERYKPKFFLWTSTIIPNQVRTYWCDYIESENFFEKINNKKLWRLKIKDNSKILEVSLENVRNGFLTKYIFKNNIFKLNGYFLDYEKIIKDGYDIIHYSKVTNLPGTLGGYFMRLNFEGKERDDLEIFHSITNELDCYDCSVILNFDIIDSFKKVEDFKLVY